MNRRTALKSLAGVLVAPVVALWPRKAKAQLLHLPRLGCDFSKFSEQVRQALYPRKGVNGETYFLAGEGRWPIGADLFLDGRNVTLHASEVDVVAGWVVLFDCDLDGQRVRPFNKRLHRGALEIREPVGNAMKITTADGVSFVRTAIISGLTA